MYSIFAVSLATIAIIGIFVVSVESLRHTAVRSWYAAEEAVLLSLFPSAERAYAYGGRHLDGNNVALYDVDRAEVYFEKAISMDKEHAYAHHELARIAFLKGDFVKALSLINLALEYNDGSKASSYYVRGLILGYMERYDESADDYERFLDENPINWAAINDYAWVLLKAGRIEEAAVATLGGLRMHRDNPWLLNTNAIALYELGYLDQARHQARAAIKAVHSLDNEDWSLAYPGNDPFIAREGLHALQDSIMRNMHTIADAARSGSYNE